MISLEIGVLADCWLRFFRQRDPRFNLHLDKVIYSYIVIYCIAVGGWIEYFLVCRKWYGQLAYGVLAAYLLVAAIQDIQCCEVYDILHILVMPAGIPVLVQADCQQLIALLLFVILQYGLFMRFYGAADGYAFMVCAVYLTGEGRGILIYLLHMFSAFLLLAIVQGSKGNINRKGNLRKEVPFLPYIAATVWLFL